MMKWWVELLAKIIFFRADRMNRRADRIMARVVKLRRRANRMLR